MNPSDLAWNGLLFVAILAGTLVLVLLIGLPGLIARRRGHPNARAIQICALFGLLLFPFWIVALIWAYTEPDRSRPAGEPDYHLGLHQPPAASEMPGRARQRNGG